MKKTRRRERCCRGCFAFIPFDSRKCQFCGYKYKSSGKYLFDKIKQALKTDRAYTVNKVKTRDAQHSLFTLQEIEYLLKMENRKIQMFLVLDDLAFLDEMALIELGETLSMMSER
ncbi:MAG: hypothetical protein LH472_05935 [Pyrinomonadaceae bacterium]|nr:hypothetical protein [Pyrinomonadaceae bacterium]